MKRLFPVVVVCLGIGSPLIAQPGGTPPTVPPVHSFEQPESALPYHGAGQVAAPMPMNGGYDCGGAGCGCGGRRGGGLGHIWAWCTYRPTRAPECRLRECAPCTPPPWYYLAVRYHHYHEEVPTGFPHHGHHHHPAPHIEHGHPVSTPPEATYQPVPVHEE